MARQFTTVELKFLQDCLRKSQIGRADADRLWVLVEKIDRLIEEEKHGKTVRGVPI
jgi:hypothetical protein